jgi:hypothetical protein
MKYINGLSIDGRPTDKTYLPESIIRTGGDVAFSLSGKPNKDWGTAESAAPPSFGGGSSAVTVNISRPVVGIAPGSTGAVTLDVQRMIDGATGYTINATSTDTGITAAPVSGKFAADGSAAATVAITVAQSVPPDYYLVYLTTAVGDSTRRSVVLVTVEDTTGEG